MHLLKKLIELLFPRKCPLCTGLLESREQDICTSCRRELPWFHGRKPRIPYVNHWSTLWFYEGNVRASLLRYKFGGRRHYAAQYAPFLAELIRKELPEGFDSLSYVPISRRRRFRRGYDQDKLLAQAVGKELGLPVVQCLRKVRHTPPQSSLANAAMRRANVLGVYAPCQSETISGKRVLLLDDIITTGATVSECAKVLRLANAEAVYCISVASRLVEK